MRDYAPETAASPTKFQFCVQEGGRPFTVECQGRFVPGLVPELLEALRQPKIDWKKTM